MQKFRLALKHTFRWVTFRIQGGPLIGLKWIAWSGKRFLRGDYEPKNTAAIMANIEPGQTTYDVGGHVGYYAILQAKIVGDQGQVFCFEPRPLNITYIKQHIAMNQIDNITLVESAVSDLVGQAKFESRVGTGTGHLSDGGDLAVCTTAIDKLVEHEGYPAPDFIKLDIEGGEVDAINGARNTIAKHRPRMLIGVHGKPEHKFVLGFLDQNQYEYEILNPGEIVDQCEILAWPAKSAA